MLLNKVNRRTVLRGTLGGAAVTVGLPVLDCFLNSNGTALAATGKALPPVFGTWTMGLGFTPGFWEPKVNGANYEFGEDLKILQPLSKKINIWSGLRIVSSQVIPVHTGGIYGLLSGGMPPAGKRQAATIDNAIADQIGTRSRFRSLEVSCDGTPTSFSKRAGAVANPSEFSPVAFYQRIFGADYVDPNVAEYKPDPAIMLRKSALSAVSDQRADLLKTLGTSDRARLDEYFTSLRTVEKQLEIMLEKPEPLPSCKVANQPEETERTVLIDHVQKNHELFVELLAAAIACGQTQVVNVNVCGALSHMRMAGSSNTYHTYTHEEAVDSRGYQQTVGKFQRAIAEMYFKAISRMESYKEGDKTLLDRMAVLYVTDHGDAKVHGNENVPVWVAGSAGGRFKTGLHIPAKGETLSRVGLTMQQAFGVSVANFGTEGNATARAFSEIMA
jgi:hypothetical protein